MITPSISAVTAVALFSCSLYAIRKSGRKESRERLQELLVQQDTGDAISECDKINWESGDVVLSGMQDRLGKAGFFSRRERKRARHIMWAILGGCCALGAGSSLLYAKTGVALGAGLFGGFYLGLMVWLYWLRYRSRDVEREMLFQLPLVLEGIILLVESGMGVLPAIERMVSLKRERDEHNPVFRILRLVYELAAHGMPFGRALETVGEAVELKAFRHVLLHLDISTSEGGELIPSLRNLSDYAHTEWRLSVETRVKRLENLVVFPVFASVIGLMFLVTAVPIVPVLDFLDTLDAKESSIGVVE